MTTADTEATPIDPPRPRYVMACRSTIHPERAHLWWGATGKCLTTTACLASVILQTAAADGYHVVCADDLMAGAAA